MKKDEPLLCVKDFINAAFGDFRKVTFVLLVGTQTAGEQKLLLWAGSGASTFELSHMCTRIGKIVSLILWRDEKIFEYAESGHFAWLSSECKTVLCDAVYVWLPLYFATVAYRYYTIGRQSNRFGQNSYLKPTIVSNTSLTHWQFDRDSEGRDTSDRLFLFFVTNWNQTYLVIVCDTISHNWLWTNRDLSGWFMLKRERSRSCSWATTFSCLLITSTTASSSTVIEARAGDKSCTVLSNEMLVSPIPVYNLFCWTASEMGSWRYIEWRFSVVECRFAVVGDSVLILTCYLWLTAAETFWAESRSRLIVLWDSR